MNSKSHVTALKDNSDKRIFFDNLWFDDADTVFRAGKYKFRVYRGLLCKHSKFFRDKLAMPHGQWLAGNTPRYKNMSPRIIILADNPKDLYYFFLAIFDASFYRVPPSDIPLDVTVSILKLAYKYQIPFLLRRAVGYLDYFFPVDKEKLLEAVNSKHRFGKSAPSNLKPTFRQLMKLARKNIPDMIEWTLRPSIMIVARIGPLAKQRGLAEFNPATYCWICNSCNMSRRIQTEPHTGLLSRDPPSFIELPHDPKLCGKCQHLRLEHRVDLDEDSLDNLLDLFKICWSQVQESRNFVVNVQNQTVKKFESVAFPVKISRNL